MRNSVGHFLRRLAGTVIAAAILCLSSEMACAGEPDFSKARQFVEHVVLKGQTNGLELLALDGLYVAGKTVLTTRGGPVTPPMDGCWVFFCDDDPSANWAHPCRYIFIAGDLSAFDVRQARWPLEVEGQQALPTKYGMIPVIPFLPKWEEPRAADIQQTRRGTMKGINYGTTGSNCYAVIISGGESTNNNSDRFWRDAALAYSTLVNKYAYPKTNMYVLVADGTNPAVDQFDFVAASTGGYWYTSTPVDFDGDGVADITGEASAANVSNAFAALQGRLTPQDQLLVFATDHGGPTSGGNPRDVEILLWNHEVLRDADMKAFTTNLPCPVIFLFEQCYSGGFLDDLTQPDRIVMTAADYNRNSYAKLPYPFGYCEWAYNMFSALRGYFPSNYTPWVDGAVCNADYNEDGYVSFHEASRFAGERRITLDSPQYQENLYYSGHHTFPVRIPEALLQDSLDRFDLSNIRSPQAIGHPFSFNVTAYNVLNEVLTNYNGSALLKTLADDWDEGVYIGTGTVENYDYPINCGYWDERVQMIIPATDFPGACVLTNTSIFALHRPEIPLNQWTIRMKHTALDEYPTNAEWESSGWTVVYQANETIASTGWVCFAFFTPFEYNGTNNLMVDFSFNNSSNGFGAACQADTSPKYRTLAYQTYLPEEEEDPLTWAGTNPPPDRSAEYPILRFGPLPAPVNVGVSPASLTGFVNGVWSGELRFLNSSHNMRVQVSDSQTNIFKRSNDFTVKDYLFEMGLPEFGPNEEFTLKWNSGTGETYRVLISSNLIAGFHSLATNLPATPPLNTFTGKIDAAPYVFFCIEAER